MTRRDVSTSASSRSRSRSPPKAFGNGKRYICIDFETNGFAKGRIKPTPHENYPTQVALVAVEEGEVTLLWSSFISGATSLAEWVVCNTPVTLEKLKNAPSFEEVLKRMQETVRPTDVIVCHNLDFDLRQVLQRTAYKLKLDASDFLKASKFCTMRCAYSDKTFRGKWPKMADLCNHFGVKQDVSHCAVADSTALAQCVAEALRRGVML
mgnify:CR=1 FL=1